VGRDGLVGVSGVGCIIICRRPPFLEGGDCELLLLKVSKHALSIFIMSASVSICVTRVSLLVRISVRRGSIWFRMGVTSACAMRWRSACRLFRISSFRASKSIFCGGKVDVVCCVRAAVGVVVFVFLVCSVVMELVVVSFVDCLGFLVCRLGNSLGSKVNWNFLDGLRAGGALNFVSVVVFVVGWNLVFRASA